MGEGTQGMSRAGGAGIREDFVDFSDTRVS